MSTSSDRPWRCTITIASEHAGLKPYFAALENSLYACLSEIDDPRQVRDFIEELVAQLQLERGRLRRLRSLNRDGKRGALR